MKAIINGTRYDTDKAVCIGEATYNGLRSDFQWWEAGLYRTPRSNRYFLAGRGGPMTRWANHLGPRERTGGNGIIRLDEQEALDWAEHYLTTAEIEAGFGAQLEDA